MKTNTSRILAAGVVAIAWSCSSDNTTTSSLVCGPGTAQQDNECVAVSGPSDDAGDDVVTVADAGADVSLGTPPPNLPFFAGVTAVAPASGTSLLVAWNAAKDAVTPPSRIVYRVYVATTTGGETFTKPSLVTPPGAVSAEVTGLKAGTPYFVVVRAVNEAGKEDMNAVEKTSKPESDTKAPTFGGVATATALGPASVELKWSAGTDDKTPPEGLSYEVHWSTSPSLAAQGTTAGISDPGATSMVISGLPTPQTTYYFVVRARDAAGNRDQNTKGAAATTTADTTPPVFGGCTSVGAITPGSAVLNWLPAADDGTIPSNIVYTVYASTSPPGADGGFDLSTSASFTGTTSGRISGLLSGKDYYFVCRATDASGNQEKNLATRGATTVADMQAPLFNGATAVFLEGNKKAELTWVAASDDKTPTDLIIYDVFQGPSTGAEEFGAPVVSSTPGATSVVVTGLQPSVTYFWVVRARDEAKNLDTNTVEMTATTINILSFENDVQPLLSRSCAKGTCHTTGTPTPPLGLTMDDGVAYGHLVGVPSVQDGRPRIDPGNRGNSYLFLKISGNAPVGVPMPPASSPFQALSPAEIDLIGNWIDQGAANN